MKDIILVINKKIDERGITMTNTAKRAGISPDLLYRTLDGKRKLKADELISLCQVLDLTLADFKEESVAI